MDSMQQRGLMQNQPKASGAQNFISNLKNPGFANSTSQPTPRGNDMVAGGTAGFYNQQKPQVQQQQQPQIPQQPVQPQQQMNQPPQGLPPRLQAQIQPPQQQSQKPFTDPNTGQTYASYNQYLQNWQASQQSGGAVGSGPLGGLAGQANLLGPGVSQTLQQFNNALQGMGSKYINSAMARIRADNLRRGIADSASGGSLEAMGLADASGQVANNIASQLMQPMIAYSQMFQNQSQNALNRQHDMNMAKQGFQNQSSLQAQAFDFERQMAKLSTDEQLRLRKEGIPLSVQEFNSAVAAYKAAFPQTSQSNAEYQIMQQMERALRQSGGQDPNAPGGFNNPLSAKPPGGDAVPFGQSVLAHERALKEQSGYAGPNSAIQRQPSQPKTYAGPTTGMSSAGIPGYSPTTGFTTTYHGGMTNVGGTLGNQYSYTPPGMDPLEYQRLMSAYGAAQGNAGNVFGNAAAAAAAGMVS